jgi:hypothetical protein
MAASQGMNDDFHTLYEDESERLRHLNAIRAVAEHIGASIDVVERLYGTELKDFKRDARVKDFLPILVSKKVEYVLSVRRGKTRTL